MFMDRSAVCIHIYTYLSLSLMVDSVEQPDLETFLIRSTFIPAADAHDLGFN